MSKSKLLFIILAIVFFIILVFFALDISSRTDFPGQNKESTEHLDLDSAALD